ncbi:DUF4294 domain-containing protein [Neptunitalea lumnitzerae]|uniref:DUF4294 domain-containing protein n=1 Tax=Neptunitalea lumnitzerae TaxID=2965509 RepID=A0ABQ5ML22_9FLAO|nr:DUF4294 domain-containing protein [Neptunitalea sp. Y10]GLB50073.1 hypothetical protein Y10_24410 [Neptunitalea sp. Y10]
MNRLYIYIILLIGIHGFAQVKDVEPVYEQEEAVDTTLVEGSYNSYFELGEVVLFDKLKFTSHRKKVDYYILRRKVHKVYPYAKMAAERLMTMNAMLDSLDSKRLKKKYIKRMQDYIEDEFTEELKKMTRTEGQILIKLINRQTGESAFSLIKEYRSGWKAFWYNTTASMFNLTLKEEYDPYNNKEDFLIEDVLQRAFAAGTLEKQEDALGLSYDILAAKWKK